MSQNHSVTRLNLAPKLRRPLSLWNPLDYLRLLYWVFFFPQALRWYVKTFGGELILSQEMSWQEKWEWLHQNIVQRQLLVQGLILIVIAPVALGLILEAFVVTPNWFGLAIAVVIGLTIVLTTSVVGGSVAIAVVMGLAASVMISAAMGLGIKIIMHLVNNLVSVSSPDLLSVLVYGLSSGAAVGLALGIAMGLAFGVTFGVTGCLSHGMGRGFAFALGQNLAGGVAMSAVVLIISVLMSAVISTLFSTAFVVAVSLSHAVGATLSFCVGMGLALTVALARPENWLFSSPLNWRFVQHGSWLFPRVTPLPLPYLTFRLQIWLEQDWEIGLHNANQLLQYTLQFIPVVQAVNKVLSKTLPEQIIWRVAQLAEAPFDWDLVRFASSSLKEELRSKTVKSFFSSPILFFLAHPWREQIQARFVTEIRLNTPVRAAAAGFWYLHEKEPAKATEAFAVVRSLLYGEEMFILAQILAAFHNAQELATIAAIQLPIFPKEPFLRPVTWKAVISLNQVVEDAEVVQHSISRSARSLALNRALVKLKDVVDYSEALPQAEQWLIKDIALVWGKSLLQAAREVGEISITKPVINPYVVGDPVVGNLFVGREDIIRQLEELWLMSHQMQSVVLYGHRRMGKTSILLNITNRLGSGVKVAYVNLLILGNIPQGVGEVLIAISYEISAAVNLPPPSDENLLNLPYPTFNRYLKQIEAQLEGRLIIALDEFEKIETLIETRKIPPDFMGFLRVLVQISPKIAFAFAGLHTLEEMTADYFQPFFASAIPIHVGFQNRAATRQILANPDPDFLLDYTPESLDLIYDLTAGQPYLTQLVGFQLVRRYNDQVFEQGRLRNHMFTIEDVEAVVNHPKFFQRERYYFDGVWGQAARGAVQQQTILSAIAPHPQGLTLDDLIQTLSIESAILQPALKNLQRHDVVRETNGRIHIIVELFRRWVERK